MKTSILLADGVKQIMFTPETENEKQALGLITPDDNIHTVIHRGAFYNEPQVFGVNVFKCQGGWMRAENSEDSVMFVLTPKEDENKS